MGFINSFILGVRSIIEVHVFRARFGHGLFWVSFGFLVLVASVVISVSLKNQWNYRALKQRGQIGLNFKDSLEIIEVGGMAFGPNGGTSAVFSAVAGSGSVLLVKSGFPVFTKNVVFSVFLGFLLPLWCLTFAVEGLGAEREGKTLFWLLSKPIPRSSIYIGKFLSILPWVLIWSLGGFLVLAICAGEGGVFTFKLFWMPIVFACVAYTSVFFFMGACLPRAALIALAYAFVVETLLGSMPGSLKQLSVAFYARCIMFQKSADLGIFLESGGGYGDFSQSTAIIFLLGISLVFLIAGIYFFERMELRGQR